MTAGARNRLSRGAQYHEGEAVAWSGKYERSGFRRRIRLLEEIIRGMVSPGARWLDLGCGSGVLTRLLERFGAVGEAVDGSPSMVEAARGSIASPGPPRFRYRWIATAEALDSADSSFDGVLCSSVLEYLERPEAALDEMVRVVRPGGTLVVSVPNTRSVVRACQRMLRFMPFVRRAAPWGYLQYSRITYSRARILEELRGRGMEIDAIRSFDPVLPGWILKLVPGIAALIFVVATKPEGWQTNTGALPRR